LEQSFIALQEQQGTAKFLLVAEDDYEGVAEFIYLGTLITNDNNVEKEIQRRVLACRRTYFAAIRLFRSRLLSRGTKILLYKTLIRPVVSYGAETWTMTKKEEQALLVYLVYLVYLEEYMVLNMNMGNGELGRTENWKR
jgi:hypothetical protein